MNKQQAKSVGLKTYFTGRSCKHGHVAERLVGNSGCVACRSNILSKYNNKTERKVRMHHYYETNKETKWPSSDKAYMDEYRRVHKTEIQVYMKKYRETHPDTQQKKKRKLRCVVWADKNQLENYYKEAKRLSKETGIIHEVDHVYPLLGNTVSGLHVPENLRVVTKYENRKKRNIHPDE